jgi:uncharacterized protein YecE (DUF72 family)
MSLANVRIGCQGWAYNDWVTAPGADPVFYPQGTRNEQMLELYARAFSAIEVDSTFYAIPSAASVDGWNKRTPPGFQFAFKMPQEITHKQMLRGPSVGILEEFCDRVRVLDEKLGILLLQTPPQFEGSQENMQALREFLPHLPPDIRFAIEFRNRDWLDHQIIDLLAKHNVAFALVQGQWFRDPDIKWIAANLTSDFAYIRWMGERDLTRFETIQRPQDANLQRWAHLIEYLTPKLSTIYAFFSNFYEGHAPASANKLKALLDQPVIGPDDLTDQPSLF